MWILLLSLAIAPAALSVEGKRVIPACVGGGFAPRRYFIENLGQLKNSDVRYFVKSAGMEVGFAKAKVYFNCPKWQEVGRDCTKYVGGVLFGLKVGDGSSSPRALEPLSGRSNYLLGAESDKWIKGAGHFARIVYRDVYPHIDLVFFFDEDNALTYEFHVRPGGNPAQIELSYIAVDKVESQGPAQMGIVTRAGKVLDGKLLCYQNVNDRRRITESAFCRTSDTSYGIKLLGPYDKTRLLVIDPSIVFSSYFGDCAAANRTVVIDPAGNIYMSGGANTCWPATPGAYDTTHSGTSWPDAVATKFDPNGNVIWSTFIGGPKEDYVYVSAIDATGQLYLSGRSGEGFPTTPGAFDQMFNGGKDNGNIHSATDAFVVKLSANGDSLLYSTYIGGNGNDNGRAIHLLGTGELLVAGGNSNSTNLPITPGAYKPAKTGARDSWVAKVSADGSTLVFCTYFGANNDSRPDETIRGLGVDLAGNVWIGGTTTGTGMTPTVDAFQSIRGAGTEAYVAKISADGSQLLFLSWLGGGGNDEIETEGVSDAEGNFYVCGSTGSPDFPVTNGAFQTQFKNGGNPDPWAGDGWLAKINNDGTLAFATYYGGNYPGNEGFFGPVVDSSGNVYCTGRFRSVDCPMTPDAFQPNKAGGNDGQHDAVLVVFSADGRKLLYGTYLGGSGTDIGRHIGIHPDSRSVVIIGETSSTDLPMVNNIQTTPSGSFLAKFSVETTARDVDFNADGKVNFEDYSKLAQFWLQNESSVDIAPLPFGDGIVDING